MTKLPQAMMELHVELEGAIDPPYDYHPEYTTGGLWKDLYCTTNFYLEHIGRKGWKTDWCRAARLHWMTAVVIGCTPEPEFVVEKSTEIPTGQREMINRWLEGLPPRYTVETPPDEERRKVQRKRILETREWILANKESILEVADRIRCAKECTYYLRELWGAMTEEDLPMTRRGHD